MARFSPKEYFNSAYLTSKGGKNGLSTRRALSTNRKIATLLPDVRVYFPPLTTLLNPITILYWHKNEHRYAECSSICRTRVLFVVGYFFPLSLLTSNGCQILSFRMDGQLLQIEISVSISAKIRTC